MPVPTLISELSTTPGSNSPSGADSPSVLDDHIRTGYSFTRILSDTKLDASSGVTLTGNQTIAGTKTFSSPIAGSITGNATTATTASALTSTLAIANGGTGQTTAAAAFDAIKQNATETVIGAVEIATVAEVQTGADQFRVVTPNSLRASVFGLGQSWQDVTASRAFGVTYTNSTGRPIEVFISAVMLGSATGALTVSGVSFGTVFGNGGGSVVVTRNFVVPSGSTYVLTATNVTINAWVELR